MSRTTRFLALAFVATFALAAQAKIVTKSIDYEQGGEKLEGYLAYDDANSGPRPGVLVVHEWWGLNDYVKHRAQELAGWATSPSRPTCTAARGSRGTRSRPRPG
jgi:hypothetical protein